MANELCASGFGSGVDGNYNLMYAEHWTNGTYWIYKDAFYWMITSSEFFFDKNHIVAIKAYVAGSWADGDYHTAVITVGEGGYTEGAIIGNVGLGVCP